MIHESIVAGNVMPSIAYGTWRWNEDLKTRKSVEFANQAISVGILHLDTAQNYTNEAEAGIAIRECGVPREQIFVTTKWSKVDDLDIATSFKNSLKELDLAYIDLYLIHWPQYCDDSSIAECWKEMEKLKDSGLARSIGVSNFKVEHLEQVFAVAKYIPAVNQIRFHPYIYEKQRPTVDLCKEKGIVIEGYSPLEPVRKHPGGPLNKPLSDISERLGVSMDQVLLAWVKAKGYVPVTMSTKKERLQGYFEAGDINLTEEDVLAIDEAGALGV
ncbi:hypothetical protein CVT25_003815 [Psilocybe cyanescens]|uniref:NADP-dependent oxidoreductase domain-containing protein n=1 Tax=Psilocybe cyanescens TaxID=93625 RepID=A0A409XTX1_PSICY|nr:hypothetical protein CVT25_003815 [Psilocybe cyanescens]